MTGEHSEMIEKNENNLSFYEFPHVSAYPQVVHGLFTRKGGFSHGPFQGLNMSSANGDAALSVDRNRKRLCDHMKADQLVSITQVHGTEVVCWDKRMAATKEIVAHAVLTDEKGALLLIQTADCQAVMLYDPVKAVVGNIHSGWKGSVGNIIGKTVDTMVGRYGSDPRDILAGVGPSLGPCCAEFLNYQAEIPEKYWVHKNSRHYFDFWAISRKQLEKEGVLTENICLSQLCTACHSNKDLFFSYRRDKLTGRLANVIGLVK